MNSQNRNELEAIKRELQSIINDLKKCSNGIRNDFTGIGNDICADNINQIVPYYVSAKNTLDRVRIIDPEE